MTNKPPLVAVVIPSTGEHKADMSTSLAALISHSSVNGVSTAIISEKGSLIFRSRNNMVANALTLSPDYIFSLDSDVSVPPDTILRLMRHDKDIAGATYCKRVEPYNLLGYPAQPTNFAAGGLAKFTLMPGGCMLVKAHVYQNIEWPWYFDTVRRLGDPFHAFVGLLKDVFYVDTPEDLIRSLEENEKLTSWLSAEAEFYNKNFVGNILGEDYNFSLKALKYGYDIWCDLDLTYQIAHIGDHQIVCVRPQETVPIVES